MLIQFPAIPNITLPNWVEVSHIPIIDCDETLQPTSLAPSPVGIYPVYFKMGIPDAPAECYVRTGVYQRLLTAAKSLPNGLSLVVLDGWRPFSVQQHLFDTLLNLMEHANTAQSKEQRLSEARNLVSPPSSFSNAPSPHLTGGALDVTLADSDGLLLNMGSLFDEASPMSYTASFENISQPTCEQQLSRDNRRILYNVMIDAGFTNLPSEWWHFDFGDQLWAWYSQSTHARYGATHPLSLESLWQQQLQKAQ